MKTVLICTIQALLQLQELLAGPSKPTVWPCNEFSFYKYLYNSFLYSFIIRIIKSFGLSLQKTKQLNLAAGPHSPLGDFIYLPWPYCWVF